MATTSPKFWQLTSRIRILNVVTLVILSAGYCVGVVENGTSTTCVWCGPLADHVQHSEVAPSCQTLNTTIACNPGYNYCATTATYPYLVESRYCSRVNQDECFLQYCNSTKTWKMTCTCRGKDCNGENTERENEAFTKLPRLVEAQKSRPKRNTNTDKSKFVFSEKDKTEIVTNISAAQSIQADTKNDQQTQRDVSEQPNMTPQAISKDELIEQIPMSSNESAENITDNNNAIDKLDNTEVERQTVINSPSTKDLMLCIMTVQSTKATSGNIVTAGASTSKPSEKLPTAEALQQVASSEDDDNNTEHTTTDYEPTESGASDDDEHPTTATDEPDENTAHQNTITTVLLINSLLLQYIYNRK